MASPNAAFTDEPTRTTVPPFSASALAPMLSPSASASVSRTVYRNTSAAVPAPEA